MSHEDFRVDPALRKLLESAAVMPLGFEPPPLVPDDDLWPVTQWWDMLSKPVTYTSTGLTTDGLTFDKLERSVEELDKLPKPKYTDVVMLRTFAVKVREQFPNDPTEKFGRLFGVDLHVGDSMAECKAIYLQLEGQGRRPMLVEN